MVRLFPLLNSVKEQYEQHSSNIKATFVHVENDPIRSLDRIIARFKVICRPSPPPHPVGIFYGENPLNYSFSLFMFELIFFVFINQTLRFLLKPLRQPRIVSDIIGGIILGPSILGRNQNFKKHILPDNARYVVKNVGSVGFMLFLFVSGVKMDFQSIKKIGRKHIFTALLSVAFPFVAVSIVGFCMRPSMDRNLGRISGIGAISSAMSMTFFPVIFLILKDLNLLSSEIGRMALSTTLVGDAFSLLVLMIFETLKQGEGNPRNGLLFLVSVIVFVAFILSAIRRVMNLIAENTPQGQLVNQTCVVLIFLGVFLLGFIGDMLGMSLGVGALCYGLVIPDGPPLGATLVEKSESFMMEILMPFAFMLIGFYTDITAVANYGWSNLSPLVAMLITGYLCKIIGTIGSSLLLRIPLKDSITLSLIMSLRGQVDLLIYFHFMDRNIIGTQMFSFLVLMATLMTMICAPLINILYDPSRPYMVNKRRTIQHTPEDAELKIVMCVHDEESLAGLFNLLDKSYPTQASPFSVYVLHLIELIGRATPIYIDHKQLPDGTNKFITDNIQRIYNALDQYQESRNDVVNLHLFTSVTARHTMYQDICELALTKKAELIIVPFQKEKLDNIAGTEIVRRGNLIRSLNSNVVSHAPCSVAILVDKGHTPNPIVAVGQSMRRSLHAYVVLFLGGADAREALHYADHVVRNPDVCVTVIRFLSLNNEGDNEMEKKLDDGVVTWFWVKNEANDRVMYREVVVKNGEETIDAIQALNNNTNQLWIVGRKQGINPVLLDGLPNWSENHELGVIGDFVASSDFGSSASVLVVHQQIMRGEGSGDDPGPLHKRFIKRLFEF